MSGISVDQQVSFTISGLLYEGTVTKERGDQLIVNVIRQGGRATKLEVMVSRKTVLPTPSIRR